MRLLARLRCLLDTHRPVGIAGRPYCSRCWTPLTESWRRERTKGHR